MGMSLVTARPTTRVRPSWRSIEVSPAVLISLNTSAEYTSITNLGEGERLQNGLRLGFRFLELPRCIRVGDDPGAGLDHDAVLEDERGADRDRRIETRRTPAHVAHRTGVWPAPLGLQLIDDLHRPDLGRARDGPRRKAGAEHIERV